MSIIFNLDRKSCENNKEIIFRFHKYFDHVDSEIKLKVLLNETFYEDLTLKNSLDYKINLSKICKKEKLKIDIIADNPKSLFDQKIGLNRKKRSIILSEIKIIK